MKTITFIKIGLFYFLFLLIFVGCNNHNSEETQTIISTESDYQPQTHVVEIKDMQFQPADLQVNIGDTVTWINKDMVAHDVTEEQKAWASPPIPSDSSWKKVITNNESYYCSIHVIMKGKLTIAE